MATLAELEQQARSCVRCRLAEGRTTVVFGEGAPTARLMVVGEGPGREEDQQGRPFVGRSGKLLDRLLVEEVGVGRGEVYIANVVKCRPPGNRDPLPEEISACRPYLEHQLELIRPAVVLTLGNFATKLLLDTSEGIRRTRGRSYPFGPGTVLVPTYHPAAALRGGGAVLAEMRADFVRAKEALAAAGTGAAREAAADPVAPGRAAVSGRAAASGRALVSGRAVVSAEPVGSGKPVRRGEEA